MCWQNIVLCWHPPLALQHALTVPGQFSSCRSAVCLANADWNRTESRSPKFPTAQTHTQERDISLLVSKFQSVQRGDKCFRDPYHYNQNVSQHFKISCWPSKDLPVSRLLVFTEMPGLRGASRVVCRKNCQGVNDTPTRLTRSLLR